MGQAPIVHCRPATHGFVAMRHNGFTRSFVWFSEQGFEQLLRLTKTFIGERDGLCLSHWIGDVALFMQPRHGIPIERLPGTGSVVKPQTQKRQNRLVNTICVQFHLVSLGVQRLKSPALRGFIAQRPLD